MAGWARSQRDRRVEQPLLSQAFGAEAEPAHDQPAPGRVQVVEAGPVEDRSIGRDERTRVVARVIHEVPADQVVLVAETARAPAGGRQQHSRVLHAARGQDEEAGAYPEPGPAETLHAHVAHRPRVGTGYDVDHRAVQAHHDALRATRGVQVTVGERPVEAVAIDRGDDSPALDLEQRTPRVGPVRGPIAGRPEIADLVRAGVVWVERGPVEGPAASGHPGPRLEVDRIERQVLGADLRSDRRVPGLNGASGLTPPRQARIHVGRVRRGAGGEGLDRRIGPVAPALEEDDAEIGPDKRAGDGQARRPRPDDADVGVELRAVPDVAGVDLHWPTNDTGRRA